MGRFKTMNNRCLICGEPCREKYCAEHRKEALKLYQKGYRLAHPKGKRKHKWQGCNEDCEHCPYPNCYKPATLMKPTRETVSLREKQDEELKSQGKMFTFEMGKYNSYSPNVRRKGWF